MFGYATDETPELMPLTLSLAHKINARLAECRRNGSMPYLRPDCKSQVTVEYEKEGTKLTPKRVHTIVISTQHDEQVCRAMPCRTPNALGHATGVCADPPPVRR